ncbi:hypothetical protein O181_027425 [Austropuccinia psidii MF-1]|uniref:Uncharacterized protein n=1 Tax=Austropuccinia psidii MF-1 TaxID=1389203 RepID=A0A9Q3CR31_9BASI|nr:hypothetical protein [Austropuccinia psidii MF-1]
MLCQWPAIDFMSHHSRYKALLQSGRHSKPKPIQHYSQGLGNYTSCFKPAHAYIPAPPCICDSKTAPISALITPYASTPPLLTILILPQHPQDIPPTRPSTLLTPHPLRCLPCLYLCSALLKCLQCRPSISAPTNPYAAALLPLKILRRPQYMPPIPPSTLLTPSPTGQLPSLCSCSVLLTCL